MTPAAGGYSIDLLDKADAIVEKAVDKVAAEDMKAAAKEAEAEEEA